MTTQEIRTLMRELARLAEVLGRELSESALEVYVEDLGRYALPAVQAALRAHRRDPERGRFFPVPADLLRHLEGTLTDRVVMAWADVLTAVRRYGAYASVDFGDPLTHRVIEAMGGWPALCAMPSEEVPFRAKDFTARYRALAARDAAGAAAPPYVPGLFEIENRERYPQWVPVCKLAGAAARAAALPEPAPARALQEAS